MGSLRRPWKEELDIIDRTMRAISSVNDPQELVEVYWNGIGELLPVYDYVATSRRNIEPPFYLVTRSSRFTEHLNPWKQRDRLPRLSGGILGQITYANRPVMIDDLPAQLADDDPGRFYLEGFESLVALPNYDNGEGINVTAMLLPPGAPLDRSVIPILHWQSGLFGRGTQNLVLRNELTAALEALDDELQTVGEIQRSLLPESLPSIPGWDIAAYYQTSARAGGDYYDFFPLADGRWGIFIADVSGHGTPAAVLMAITHAIAHAQPGTHTPPVALLHGLNDTLTRTYTRNGTFVTAFYAVLDPARRQLSYCSAGHNPPRLVRDGRVISLDKARALPMGIVQDEPFCEAVLTLQPGDLLLLYTDGITETMAPNAGNAEVDLFGVERLDAVLLQSQGASARESIERITRAIDSFSGNARRGMTGR